jgi:iron complex outermembrane receptor protein
VFIPSSRLLRLLPALLALSAPALYSQAPACIGAIQSVLGRVADSSQAAIPNAKVVATCGARTETAITDAEGVYRLRLEPGPWQINITSTGFDAGRQALTVVPGQPASSSNVTLAIAPSKQEVTVTAQNGLVATEAQSATKIDTPILEQPFAIQTVTATQLLQQNVQSLTQALKYTAGATPDTYGPDPRGDWFIIRGNSADVYLDGVRLPQIVNSPNSFAAVQVDPNDLQRIEILEGPSSTLYGQSNIGGIVDAVSKQPTLLPRRSIQLQGGNFDRVQGGGDFSGPLNRSASLLYSINGIARTSHTYVYGMKDDRFTLNPTLTWKPTTALSLNLFGKYFHGDTGTGAVFLPRSGTLDRNAVFGYLPVSFNTGDPVTDIYRKRQYIAGYALEYRGPSLYLHHTTRYVHSNITYSGLYSAGAYTDTAQTQLARVNFLSLPVLNGLQSDLYGRTHLRTGKFRHTLIGGVDFQWQKYLNRQGSAVPAAGVLNLRNPIYGVVLPRPALTTRQNTEQFQGGTYGQEQIQFGGWTVAAGGRYDATAQETVLVPATAAGTFTSTQQRPHAFTGHGGISYHSGGLAPYVSYSTSFLPTIGSGFDGKPFVPTRGSSYEGGLKYQLPRHMGMVTFAAFSMTQDNRTTTDQEHPQFQRQVGQVRTVGEELQATGTLIRSLDVSFNYTHLNPIVTRSNGTDYHKMLQPVAKDQLGLWTHYTVRRTQLAGLGFGGGARYQGKKWGDAANTFQTPGYTLFDGTLDYTMERWRFGVNSSNLFNKRYVSACSTLTNCYYGATRSAIGSVNYTF